MNYAAIKKTDTANGPGIRVSLFVSGCTHHCKGCFNREAWDFEYGAPYTKAVEQEILESLSKPYIRGFSLLGGEPMEPENRPTVLALVKEVRTRYPEKDIWCYTGYTFDKDLLTWISRGQDEVAELLACIDVLVDGEFIEEQKNLRLPFRGSENQRIIDVQASLKQNRVILKAIS
ncbi:MAG: anaerobic ribonucleoside-triphosphate reductase activating protein [Lachnospiraceae bacterium]|nr:anaerobic ribonucleoside-triphosphate reductase activating protein [Lachnospiraceae bacterium]